MSVPTTPDPVATGPATVHFIGIGGAGMSVIAELFLARGHRVSGSDRSDSPTLTRLAALGAEVHLGHDAKHVTHLTPGDAVVYSTAIRPDNPELSTAQARGVPTWHRSVALAHAAADKDFVAVAGTHGKTTTSAMLAVALEACGLDPSYAIGGTINGLGTGARLGQGAVFVAEADESDSSFLHYHPRVAIVTSIEPDHLDHFGDADSYERAFADFAQRLRPGGSLIASADDDGAMRLAARVRARGLRVVTYGRDESADVHLVVRQLSASAIGGSVHSVHGAIELDLAVPGEHNLLNATAAWCAGTELGVDPADLASGLARFAGTARRFELRGAAGGVRVYDDYAHNPTKIAAAVQTARTVAAGGRVIAIFQPHLYSRTRDFAAQIARSLSAADDVLLAPIYPAREDPLPGVSSALIQAELPDSQVISETGVLAEAAVGRAHPGDLIVTIGAGDITALPDEILRLLEDR